MGYGYAHPYPIHLKYIRRIFLYITRKYIVYMGSRIVFSKKRKRIAFIFHSKPISNRLDDKKKEERKKKVHGTRIRQRAIRDRGEFLIRSIEF